MRLKQKEISDKFNATRDAINQTEKAKDFIIDRVQKLEEEIINGSKEKETILQTAV